ncbi:hypothetical protein BHE74_00034954, partial [Ensete ventricosum]
MRFAKVIGKLVGNMLTDCQKKTIGLTARMSEVAGLAGIDKTSCYERKKLRSSKDQIHNQEVEHLAFMAIDNQ